MAAFRKYSGKDYADLLGRLLPRGPLFRVVFRSRLRALLEAFGNELARLNVCAELLRRDSWPGSCDEDCLGDWSAALGMTKDQVANVATLRAQMEQKLTRIGGSNPAAIRQQVADVFGVEIEVHEFETDIFGRTNSFYWWVTFAEEPDAETLAAIVEFLDGIKPAHTVLFIGASDRITIEPGRGALWRRNPFVLDAGGPGELDGRWDNRIYGGVAGE